jgi:hypothetical protein
MSQLCKYSTISECPFIAAKSVAVSSVYRYRYKVRVK